MPEKAAPFHRRRPAIVAALAAGLALLPENSGDFVDQAVAETCDRPDDCHVLWVDAEAVLWEGDTFVERMAVIAERLPGTPLFQQWSVTRRANTEALDISEPRPFDAEAPALTVPPLDSDDSPTPGCFPQGPRRSRSCGTPTTTRAWSSNG